MTSPRSSYGGGYYAASSFPDTPIYDSLVAERGTPQIAPIRVPSPYDSSGHFPALPAALPALPSGPSQQTPPQGYPAAAQQPALQQAPAPYIPQQAGGPRGYPGPQQQYQQRPAAPSGPAGVPGPAGISGYEAMRPVAPRPNPSPYDEQYGRQYPQQGGY
ncbi:DUF6643 family protein [Streptomyces varsoviensis]|uniref:DUF6643 family protein n=1 Tax=Streptomyces varsoviensis TaxID=67373 RepID=UPI0033DC07DD